MANKINISIPKPCHENWQEMTLVDKGRFCTSCQKNVFDFTTLSDREIINSFENNHNLCGRFLKTQLNRDLIKPKEKSSIWLATTSAIVSFIGLGNQEVFSQEKVKWEQTDNKVLSDSTLSNNNEVEISGVVFEEENLPLPGVNILVKGTTKNTQSDLNGNFKIKAEINDILVFSFVGAETKEFKINNSKDISIKLQMESALMGEIIITKNRNLFGRTFHSIGNWFR